MERSAFEALKAAFHEADVPAQIDMYITAEGLSQAQYRELLKMMPTSALSLLEEALA